MARGKRNAVKTQKSAPQSVVLAAAGIHTGSQFASVMSALMSDTLAGKIEPQVANAVCNISGKLLKSVEMQHKYGKAVPGQTERLLALTPIAPETTVQ